VIKIFIIQSLLEKTNTSAWNAAFIWAANKGAPQLQPTAMRTI
jgi:hypothetical protein